MINFPTNPQIGVDYDINGKIFIWNGVGFIPKPSDGTSITVDAVPTDGSNNPVASNGVFDALANKVNTSDQTAANVIVDATGFNGNLSVTDTNQQAVNQKFDDLDLSIAIKPLLITPFTTILDFDAFNKYFANYTQTGIISFTKGSIAFGNGAQIYIKIATNGTAINFSSDFIVLQNDYKNLVASEYDLMFTLRVDGKIRVSVINIQSDAVPPLMLTYNDAKMNDQFVLIFSEGIYSGSGGSGAISVSDLQITDFVAGGITAMSITNVTNISGGVLVGGETQVLVSISRTGTANGAELFKIRAASTSSIYDKSGNAMSLDTYAGYIGFEVESLPSLPNYYAHYDLSTTPASLNGAKIITVNDISGNGRHITQATDTLRPDWSATGGANNLGYANITGSKLLASAAITLAQPFTIVLIRKITSANPIANTGFNALVPMASGVVGIYNRGYVSGTHIANNIGGIGGTALMPVYAHNAKVNTWQIDVSRINGTSSAILENGAAYNEYSAGSLPINVGTTGATKIQIGISGSTLNWNVAELIIYAGALTDAEMVSLFSYAKYKYKIARNPQISVFGDSISAGFNATLNDGFAQIIANSIGGACARWAVSGAGVTTPATTNVTDRINNAIAAKMPKQSYVIVQVGTNIDGAINGTWADALKANIQALKTYGITTDRICLASPPYTSTRVANLALINGYMAQIALDEGVIYVDCTAATLAAGGDSLIADGTHPNDAGHLVMANTIRAALVL